MNGLSLFSGIGGLDVALSEWVRPVAYCEIDPYCQGVLLSNIFNNKLNQAPIWDDIKTLRSSDFIGIVVDIIYGGFPCQDVSIAGLGKGLAGERSSLYFELSRIVNEIKPRWIFLENVPAITTRGGIEVVKNLASMGYDCRWLVNSAISIGGLHKRERWFLLAHANSKPIRKTDKTSQPFQNSQETWLRSSGQDRGEISKSYWEENQCPFLGVDDGLPNELDRAKGLGNAVVSQQAKEAFKILMGLK